MKLFCFGLGYVAARLGRALLAEGWTVHGTTRSTERLAGLRRAGFQPHVFDGGTPDEPMAAALAEATHVLVSTPPDDESDTPDVALAALRSQPARAALGWVGYLATTGVYGDAGGAWVDEDTPVAPPNARSRRRVAAEAAWARFQADTGIAVDILRLAGIYGPGRSVLDQVRDGTARRLVKPGQVFSRIHVDDIVAALKLCIASPSGLRTFNVCDDAPAPQPEVIAYAAALLGIDPPPEEDFDTAEMSAMKRSFWAANRRVSNAKLKRELGWAPQYPTYKAGLMALVQQDHHNR